MAAFPFDTHEAFTHLRDAGVTEPQAEALVTTICEALPVDRNAAPFHPEQAVRRLCDAGYSPKAATTLVRVFRRARGENVHEQQGAFAHQMSD